MRGGDSMWGFHMHFDGQFMKWLIIDASCGAQL